MYHLQKKMNTKIISPMARGGGSWVVHHLLENHISNYHLVDYHPYFTLFPFVLPTTVSTKTAALIHTTPDYAVFFHRRSQPMVLTFHNYVLDRWMQNHSSWVQRLHYTTTLKFLSRMAVKKAHALTAVSHYTARLVQEDLKISKRIRVIYNGVDVDQFKPAASSPYSRKEVRVFFSGNLIRRKGAHWLPSIARGLGKNIRIYYTQGLRTQKNLASNSKLQPIGSVSFKDMANRYRQMDLLVMPSVREGFGLAVAEAMSCGLPVVASNSSAIPELIDDGKGGFLCPVGDVKTFADKINLLADSPKLRREMGEYNRAKVEKMFTLDRMVKEYQDLFQEVLG
jgi:glycosyltransferase involved in cell wall biosynthesis